VAEVSREKVLIVSTSLKHGSRGSSAEVHAIGRLCESEYAKIVEQAMRLIHDYLSRSPALSVGELVAVARRRLEGVAAGLLSQVSDAGSHYEAALNRYRQSFDRFREEALSDIQTGFIGGQDMTTANAPVFNITNSSVGAINTGHVHQIEVSLNHLHQAGKDDAGAALKALTEAILDAQLATEQRDELIEHVAFLGEQATAVPADRKLGMIKRTMETLTQSAGTVSAIAGAWQAAEPIVKSLFGS
jgi:hypothetical protein